MRERHVALIALLGASLSGCAADTLPLQGEIEATGGSGSVSSTDTPGSDTTGGGATAPTSGLLNVHEIAGTGVWGGDAAFVGDLDHDGFADLAILDHTVRPPLLLPSLGAYGAVYGFYGRARFPAQIDTTAADFVLLGATTGIGALGDVDGDGFDDFGFVSNCAVACDSTTGVHIVFGGAERLAGVHLSNTVGITWQVPSGWSPVSAQGAGDVNGDGLPDIVIDTNWPQTALLFGRTPCPTRPSTWTRTVWRPEWVRSERETSTATATGISSCRVAIHQDIQPLPATSCHRQPCSTTAAPSASTAR